MKISVVMASYNGEKYLVEQLDTIRNQSVFVDELIICDDCSSDRTVEIAEKYIADNGLDNNWKVVINERNMGYANNFNKATLLATGDLIFFADQDDLWRDDKLQIMINIMEKNHDCMVLCTDYEPFYDGQDVPTASKKTLERMPDNGVLEKITLAPKNIYIGALGCCMCVRRGFYHSLQPYWFDGWAQDDRMWRLSQCADGCYILHANLLKHRIHDNNTSTYGKYHTIPKRLQLFQAMQNANRMMKQMLEDNSADSERISIMKKHIEMMDYRIDLLEKKNLFRSIQLVRYFKYYQEIKSFLVEMYLVLRSGLKSGKNS